MHVVVPDIGEILRITQRMVQVKKENGQAIVQGVASRVDNLGCGKKPLDQSQIKKIIRALVRYELATWSKRRKHCQIFRFQGRETLRCDFGHRLGEWLEHGTHGMRQEIKLAARDYARMSGQHLFGQGRAGTKHAAYEDRPGSTF